MATTAQDIYGRGMIFNLEQIFYWLDTTMRKQCQLNIDNDHKNST